MDEPKVKRVLVVDDEDLLRKVLSRQIENLGYECHTASSGPLALELVEPGKYDLILLDYRMPDMNGIETLKRILEKDPKSAILMLTAQNDVETAVTALKAGAYDYLSKPVTMEELKLALQRSLELRTLRLERETEEQRLKERVAKAEKQLEASYLDTVMALAAALEAKDKYTQGHSERVTLYAMALARKAGLSQRELDMLSIGGQLHDIGKIGIREDVLNKNGKLTDEEYEHVKNHPLIGAQILGRIKSLVPLLPIVRHHHERYDGRGYPDGLKGEEIPIAARVVAVADAFDAMTSTRAYRAALSTKEARRRLESGKGSQFDARLVDLFQELLDSGEISISDDEPDAVEEIEGQAPNHPASAAAS